RLRLSVDLVLDGSGVIPFGAKHLLKGLTVAFYAPLQAGQGLRRIVLQAQKLGRGLDQPREIRISVDVEIDLISYTRGIVRGERRFGQIAFVGIAEQGAARG